MTKKQLDAEDCGTIEVLYNQQNFSQEEIAEKLGVSQSTLSRELTRGSRKGHYDAKRAQKAAMVTKTTRKHKRPKVCGRIKDKVISLLKERFSPQQIAKTLWKDDGFKISRVAIYGQIKREDKGGDVTQYLRRKGGRGRRRRGLNRLKIPNCTDISECPDIIIIRSRYGDWECDLIEGTKHSGYFLSLVERKSRFGILRILSSKNSELVAQEVNKALRGFFVHTVTYDNGTEFAKHEKVNESFGCVSFFCKPYASWEKGGVKRFNGVVRDFYPKALKFTGITQAVLQTVCDSINRRPLDVLQDATPKELFSNILLPGVSQDEVCEFKEGSRPTLLVDSSQE